MRRRIATAIATSFMILFTSTLGATAQPAEEPKPPPTSGSLFPKVGIPESLILAVNTLESSPDWQHVSDLSWNERTQILSVHYVNSIAGLNEVVSRYLPPGSFNLVKDRYSHKQLVIEAQPIADIATQSKFPLASVGASTANTSLIVEYVSNAENAVSADSLSAFKSLVAKVTSFPVEYTAISAGPVSAGRLDDHTPFWGGNLMHNQSTNGKCTSGFGVRNSSSWAMLTADHCGSVGEKWSSGGGTGTSGNYEGTARDGNSGGSDFVKLTGSSYGSTVWLGDNNSDNQSVKGSYNAVAGARICTDGAFSGQRCNMRITNPDYIMCLVDLGVCYNNEVRFVNDNRSGVIQKGDSGSPSLKGASGGALVGGVLSGFYPNAQASSCLNGSPGPCYFEGFYAAVRAFLTNNPGWQVSTS